MNHHVRPANRRTKTALLSGGAFLLALLLIQCRPVADRVTGGDFRAHPANPADCILACVNAANDLMRAESELHVANVKACDGDPACQALEEERHEQAVEQIQAQRQACIGGCHRQGGGGGGS